MEEEKDNNPKSGILKYTKETERSFFFYATIAMFIVYLYLRLFGQ